MIQRIIQWFRKLFFVDQPIIMPDLDDARKALNKVLWTPEMERQESAMFNAAPAAFWLDPQRWDGINKPNRRDPGSTAFWMIDRELPANPKPEGFENKNVEIGQAALSNNTGSLARHLYKGENIKSFDFSSRLIRSVIERYHPTNSTGVIVVNHGPETMYISCIEPKENLPYGHAVASGDSVHLTHAGRAFWLISISSRHSLKWTNNDHTPRDYPLITPLSNRIAVEQAEVEIKRVLGLAIKHPNLIFPY